MKHRRYSFFLLSQGEAAELESGEDCGSVKDGGAGGGDKEIYSVKYRARWRVAGGREVHEGNRGV